MTSRPGDRWDHWLTTARCSTPTWSNKSELTSRTSHCSDCVSVLDHRESAGALTDREAPVQPFAATSVVLVWLESLSNYSHTFHKSLNILLNSKVTGRLVWNCREVDFHVWPFWAHEDYLMMRQAKKKKKEVGKQWFCFLDFGSKLVIQ